MSHAMRLLDQPGVTEDIGPFEPCVSCSEEQTITAVGLRGSRDWVIAELARIAAIAPPKAREAFLALGGDAAAGENGTSAERTLVAVRLCRECARRGGVVVREIGDRAGLPIYEEPVDGCSRIELGGRFV